MENKCFRDLLTGDLKTAKISLLGIPYDKNASVGKGASFAPDNLRALSYHLPALTKDAEDISGFKLYDMGNVVANNDEKVEDYFACVQKEAFRALTLTPYSWYLGGDHSIAIATERAFYDYALSLGKEPVIIHIDAHPDICDIYEGSKYSHACPIRRAIDYGYKTENIVLIGMRGFEAQEVSYFNLHPELKVYSSSYLNANGLNEVIAYLNKTFADDRYLVYLSYDIDANDPSFAPGTGTPEAFGLTSKMVLTLILDIVKNLNVKAMDLVEIAPPLDVNDVTSWLGLKTMYEIFNVLLKKEKKHA